jgi:hypothetical protein
LSPSQARYITTSSFFLLFKSVFHGELYGSTHGCQGDFWKKNETTGAWEGNPVFDLTYSALHESLKKEYQRSGDSNHSLPMLPKDIEKMFAFADAAVEQGKLTKTQCLFWKAFVSISFTLWTR